MVKGVIPVPSGRSSAPSGGSEGKHKRGREQSQVPAARGSPRQRAAASPPCLAAQRTFATAADTAPQGRESADPTPAPPPHLGSAPLLPETPTRPRHLSARRVARSHARAPTRIFPSLRGSRSGEGRDPAVPPEGKGTQVQRERRGQSLTYEEFREPKRAGEGCPSEPTPPRALWIRGRSRGHRTVPSSRRSQAGKEGESEGGSERRDRSRALPKPSGKGRDGARWAGGRARQGSALCAQVRGAAPGLLPSPGGSRGPRGCEPASSLLAFCLPPPHELTVLF